MTTLVRGFQHYITGKKGDPGASPSLNTRLSVIQPLAGTNTDTVLSPADLVMSNSWRQLLSSDKIRIRRTSCWITDAISCIRFLHFWCINAFFRAFQGLIRRWVVLAAWMEPGVTLGWGLNHRCLWMCFMLLRTELICRLDFTSTWAVRGSV